MYKTDKVPTTKEEVIEKFNRFEDKFFASCVIGIFECRIGMGEDVLTAYDYTLKTVTKIMLKK